MKLPAYTFRWTSILIFAIVLTSIASCRHHKEPSPFRQELADINDTLRAGNIAQAIIMTGNLKHKAIKAGDSLTWCEALVQQGINSYYSGNAPQVLAYSDTAISWLTRQPTSTSTARLLAKAYQQRGAYYDQFHFNADSAVHYFRKAVENTELSGARNELPQTLANYANALRMASVLDSAAFYYHRAIATADSLKTPESGYIVLYNGIASVFSDMHDYDNSAKWWGKSMEIIESMDKFDKFNTLTGYGNHLYYSGNYADAEKAFLRIQRMLDSVPGSEWESMFTKVNIADVYIRTGRSRQALNKLDSAFNYFTVEQPNPMVISYIQTLRMRAATELGEYQKGLEMAEMYPEADTLRLEQHLARLKAMENLYANIGNHRLAYITRCRHDQLDDSLRSFHLNQQISALNAIYERDHRILNLETGNTEQRARIYKLTAAIAIAIAVIIGLILFFVMRRINMKKREERMMKKIISLRQENLRNRVTPHFIYNALNHELHNEKKGKESHLDSLIDLIRRQQIIASEILVPFSEELKFTDDYIKVIGDNGRDPFDYSYSIDPGIDTGFAFPSMTLQILVENAFKHGFPTLGSGETRHLRISVNRVSAETITVSVFNNCGPTPSGAEKGGTGLRVLLETIRLINEHNRQQIHFHIDMEASLDGMEGCNATITLPDNLKP